MAKRSALDKQIARAEHELLALRRLKNSHAFISRVPVEILAHIFSFFKASSSSIPHSPCDPPTWLAVTHVCQRWRHVALSFPSLWTDILMHKHWLSETLTRSKRALICIHIDVYGDAETLQLIRTVLGSVGRAKELVMNGLNLSPYVEDLCREPAPFLETLEITERSWPVSLKEHELFLGKTPRLRRLSLRGCSFSWASPIFCSTLTHLAICDIETANIPTPSELRDILAALPDLRHLALNGPIPRLSHKATMKSVTKCHSPIFLPHLRFLHLRGHAPRDLLGVMSQISIPHCEVLRLSSGTSGSSSGGSSSSAPPARWMTACIAGHLKTISSPNSQNGRNTTDGYRAIAFSPGGHKRGFAFVAGTCRQLYETNDTDHPLHSYHMVWDDKFYLDLCWEGHAASRCNMEVVFRIACASLPLHDVDTVFVDSDFFREPKMWWIVFGRMAHVKRLVVTGYAVDGLLAALRGEGRQAESSESDALFETLVKKYLPEIDEAPAMPQHLFPELSQLTVEGVDLNRLFDDLIGGLCFRSFKKNGLKRLSRLYLRSCNVRYEHLVRLAGCLSHSGVDWDEFRSGLIGHESVAIKLEDGFRGQRF
ncbi:hypothetical protein BV25DRAFT_1563253 [Artomyces pyxidatus]|uniref:Uncharacterized protein n=1 Tax=Artomyces pyxidatus TaxID=48021 RepID=A0ACB8SKU2_9AGAM|nr:hypothetical protein BV25DRAFT_1563253 [Artomyces pyxidatus]